MFKRIIGPSKKWLILGFACLLLPLYQNMSPFDQGQSVDIREYAPRRPSGYLENPMASYVPHSLSGSNLNEIGESLLGHNFDPMVKRSELFGLSLLGRSDSYTQSLGGAGYFNEYHQAPTLRLDLVGPSQLRLSYGESSGFTMSCQADAHSGVSLQMNHLLSRKIHVGVSHETSAQLSQVKMGMDW